MHPLAEKVGNFFPETGSIIVAVSGGIATEAALGSRSTYAIGALGGAPGRRAARSPKAGRWMRRAARPPTPRRPCKAR